MSEQPQIAIDYNISFLNKSAHYAHVQMMITGVIDVPFIDVKLPVWSPGSYLIREYAKNIEAFECFSILGNELPFQKISKNCWRIDTSSLLDLPENLKENIQVEYDVYCNEISVRTNHVDEDHAFIVPTATFMYIEEFKNVRIELEILKTRGFPNISTGLTLLEGHKNVFVTDDWDIFYDSPIEIGHQDFWTFEAEGIPHEFAMVGGGGYDKKRLSQDITLIIEKETEVWGSNPNQHYVFITHNRQHGGGGLEHLNSCVLGASRNAYTNETSYKNFLSLVAHEYFHLWNVKRLRPKALGPFNYNAENYTTSLWMMEGFTAYYDNLIVKRCGFFNEEEYLNMLVVDFNTVLNRPGHLVQSAANASFDAWIKFYRPDENSINSSISYYNKGAMLTAMMDIKIIASTDGQRKFDDVLRAAYQHFYLLENRGFEENEFLELAQDISGVSLKEIFEAAYSTEDLDYNAYFNLVGYELIDEYADREEKTFGFTTSVNDGNTFISTIEKDTNAFHADINVKDEIIAINGVRMDSKDKEMNYIMTNGQPDEEFQFLISRDGIIRNVNIPLQLSKKKSYRIQKLKNATPLQQKLGEIWLS